MEETKAKEEKKQPDMMAERESAIIGLGNNLNAIVDLEDLPKLSKIRWFAEKHGNTYYCVTSKNKDTFGKKIYMHHIVKGNPPVGMEVDHCDGNGLNNKKNNIRFCSHKENCQARRKRKTKTSSKYKGVSWDKERKQWMVRIMGIDGKNHWLGRYNSELDAAKAYDEAAMEMFGNFAQLNIPKPPKETDRLFPD
ncbi:MAG: AP2 domain-containing protein [Planctomycetota bacterium]